MKTEQEEFSAGDFGSEYIIRNDDIDIVASNPAFFELNGQKYILKIEKVVDEVDELPIVKPSTTYDKIQHDLGYYQITPTPSFQDLETYYKDRYYQNLLSFTYLKEYSEEEMQYIHNKAKVAEMIILNHKNNNSFRLFEVGCGEGFFASHFLEQGWDIKVCDFSSAGIDMHNKHILPYLEQGDTYSILDKEYADGKKYDFINMAYVLEHVVDPLELINKIKKIIDVDGILRIVVPNDFSDFQKTLLEQNIIENEFWFLPPEHLNYFTFETCKNLLISCGFSIIKEQADFNIELFLANPSSNYNKNKSTGAGAHKARILIDNFLVDAGINNYIEYMEKAAQCSFSRSVILYAKLS